MEILFRDASVVVVNKPAGLLVHRGWAQDEEVAMTLVRDLVGAYVYPVHRLDRGASGALAFALTAEAARALGDAFANGAVGKRYLALVRGVPPDHGVIDHPIPRREDGPRVPASTEFRRIESFGRYSLVEAIPRTGRLHQIRRHPKHISCPLIGDVRYGKGEHNRLFREQYGLHRLALHASGLEFSHPADSHRVAIEAPLAADMRAALVALASPDAR